ncbi:hypothetical protein FACS1894130_06120 [Spirochaetia bacterium]|nr:hypothetical protein FACS1894130_06120 [Spirochaetia bacterium]
MKKVFCSLCAFLLVLSVSVFGQDNSPPASNPGDDEIVLPSAEIKAKKDTSDHITQEEMQERGDTNLLEAIRWIPGIVINGGGHAGKDQGGFSVRGATGGPGDEDWMSVFIDGVPAQASAEGRVDYGSILTGNFESIEVAKGYSSGILGPGAIGGALILRTAKPKKPLELAGRSTINLDGGGYAGTVDSISAGTRLGIFYARGGFTGNFTDHWRLSEKFEPANDDPPPTGNPQKEGNRIFSESTAIGANVMLGVTPLDDLDIWVNYAYSFKDKGWTPPGLGIVGTSYTMAAYPSLIRHNGDFHVEWTPSRFNLNLAAYFELIDDTRLSVSNPNWQNYLDDKYTYRESEGLTVGVNLGGAFTINDWSNIRGAFQFKHVGMESFYSRGNNEEPAHDDYHKMNMYKDNIYFTGVEYSFNPFKPLTTVVGFGIDVTVPQEMLLRDSTFQDTVTRPFDPNVLPQWTIGLFYDLTENQELHLTYAKKNRFPDWRYRTQHANAATQKPNLGLIPEQMHHFELGHKGFFLESIRLTSALYMSLLSDGIVTVNFDVADSEGYTSQKQNIASSLYYGFEFGMEILFNEYLSLGGSMAMLKYEVLHNPDEIKNLGGRPQYTANGYFTITPLANIDMGWVRDVRVTPRFEYVASMYDLSNAGTNATNSLPDYMLLHLNITTEITQYFSLSFAVLNLLDENYYVFRDHPSPGRSFSISLGAKY